MQRITALLLLLTMSLFALTACGQTAGGDASGAASAPAASASAPAEADEEENYDTGDASQDDPLNQDGIGENELLVVSFGTSFNDSRRLTIGAIERAIAKAFPDWSVRRGFTSQIIIDDARSGVQRPEGHAGPVRRRL